MKATSWILAIAFSALAVSSASAQRPPEPWLNDVPREFRLLYAGPGTPPGEIPGLWAAFPCDSISYEFTFEGGGARGSAGDYVVTLHRAVTTAAGANAR
jgi:hypothetical protein